MTFFRSLVDDLLAFIIHFYPVYLLAVKLLRDLHAFCVYIMIFLIDFLDRLFTNHLIDLIEVGKMS